MERTMKRIWGIIVTVVTFALLTACGGSGSSSPSAASLTPISGVFANVSGLGYSSGSKTGTTDAIGSFTYVPGNTVKFSVGDIVIGTAPGGSVMTPLHLVPGSDAATPPVVNVMRFLMSIGTYDATNLTISIPAAVLDAAKGEKYKTLDIATTNDVALGELVQSLTGKSLVNAGDAIHFLSWIIYKKYGGTYRGSFTGLSTSPYWRMEIDADGKVSGQGVKSDQVTEIGTESLTGSMTNGIKLGVTADGGCVLSGELDLSTGILHGFWNYSSPEPGKSKGGTFIGALSH